MMNIPRFTNPHSIHDQHIVTTSRANVFPQRPRFVVDDDKLAVLDELLKQTTGSLEASHVRMRKRKRHTNAMEGQSTSHTAYEPAPFRLLSVEHPPKVISLEPKPLPTRIPWEPPCEDNDLEADLRRQQALSAAVDIPSLFRSAEAYISLPQKADKVIHAYSDVPLSSVVLFVAEMPPNNTRRPFGVSHDRATRPSPHEVKPKGDALPVITLEMQGSEQLAACRKRKRRRRTIERRPATFWRPLRCWGGKSSGYALGYEGSWPVEDECETELCYVRDKM
ncbi:hypothetical protein F5148DRAFT_1216856, partial [Russula earlei]